MAGPGRGLDKWFFYPGFEPGTGGLLREPGLMDARRRFDGRAWLQPRGLAPRPGERVVSLFCYPSAPLAELLQALADAHAAAAHAAARRAATRPARRRCAASRCPGSSQADYDRLLWACDLNFVRGEDSFVRAHVGRRALRLADLSAARRAHAAKLDAFLNLMLADAEPAWPRPCARCGTPGTACDPGPRALPRRQPGRRRRYAGASGCWPSPTWPQLLGFVAERR